MTPKLTDEQRQALADDPDHTVKVQDEQTQRVYVLVDEQWHVAARQALQREHDLAAIREGLRQADNGEGRPLAEAEADLRAKLSIRSA